MAGQRLRSMIPKMRKNSERRKRVFAEVNKFEERGVAIDIEDVDDNLEPSEPVWHLPLLVVKERNKTKICHDAKASTKEISLNDLLLGGRNLTNNLASILLNFCSKRYVFTTNIASFFHK